MNLIQLKFGDVKVKSIVTKNQFVSHMLEHIAWRLGVEIKLLWTKTNWRDLGIALGKEIIKFTPKQNEAVVLGMIDDGSAEVALDLSKKGLKLSAVKNISLSWFLTMRCEQLKSGQPLVELLEGLAKGLEAEIAIKICSFEDPHHTWEAVFRGVGIALGRIFTPPSQAKSVKMISLNRGLVYRKTAETQIKLGLSFSGGSQNKISIDVDKSINVKGLGRLLFLISKRAGFRLIVYFKANVLSSSHVVWEDIGMVLGRALLKVLKTRMKKFGINGAGSNLRSMDDLKIKPISLGLSVEGRKFFKIFPADLPYQVIRRRLLGQNIFGNLRSEDLDDFLDGLCGGLGCSLVINVKKITNAQNFWAEVFAGLGDALKETFTQNFYRKGVPPGVKANLS